MENVAQQPGDKAVFAGTYGDPSNSSVSAGLWVTESIAKAIIELGYGSEATSYADVKKFIRELPLLFEPRRRSGGPK